MLKGMGIKRAVAICAFALAGVQNAGALRNTSYRVVVGEYTKDIALKRTPSGNGMVYINFRDDHDIVVHAAKTLAKRVPHNTEMLVILGDKANGLGAIIGYLTNLPWITLNAKKPFDPVVKSVSYRSVTSGAKTMYITQSQIDKLRGKRIIVIDDILSSGSTMNAALEILKLADVSIQSLMCAFTEEKDRYQFQGYPVIKVGHLPLVRLS